MLKQPDNGTTVSESPKANLPASLVKNGAKPPVTATMPVDKKKKKGIFGGLFGKKKGKDAVAARPASRTRR